MQDKNTPLAMAIAAATGIYSGVLQAEVDDNVAFALEEVVVTAQKRTQSINDVGITMNAFTGEQLRDQGVYTAEDLAVHTPGLSATTNSTTGVPVYTIRGVGFQDYSTSASSTVGLYLDEISIPYTVMSRGALFDVARVEVLKGPQGDLYGRNTTAGQINFVSNRPTEEFEAGFTASYGRFDVVDVEGYVSGSLTDAVQGRLAFKTTQSGEGWQESVSRDDELGEKDLMALRAMLNVDLDDSKSLLLRAHWVNDESDNQAPMVYDGTELHGSPGFGRTGNDLDGNPITPIYSDNDSRAADWNPGLWKPRRDNTLKGIGLNFNWDINDDLSFTAIAGIDSFDRNEWSDWDGMAYLDSNINNITEVDTQSLELRLASNGNLDFTWVAGIYVSNDEVNEDYRYNMQESRFAVFGRADTVYEQETESSAVFGHAEWQLADQWRLTLGARYTEEERTWQGCTIIFDTCFFLDAENRGEVFKDTLEVAKWMGKITLDYELNEDILVYGTLSNGFKSGGFNGAAALTHAQLAPYTEEELVNTELGIKATLLDGRMQLNAAAFWYDYTDKQERERKPTQLGALGGQSNVPESRINGAELELKWLIAEGLNVNLGVAYLDTKVEKWAAIDAENSAPPPAEPVTFDASGLELAQSPEWQYNGSINYEWSVGDNLVMGVATDFSYTSEVTGVSGIRADVTRVEDYWLWGARASLGSVEGDWKTTLWVRNLTDEYYYPAAIGGGNATYVRINGMPRTFGVTLDYSF
jgi:iron complex outermembrane receptor protein